MSEPSWVLGTLGTPPGAVPAPPPSSSRLLDHPKAAPRDTAEERSSQGTAPGPGGFGRAIPEPPGGSQGSPSPAGAAPASAAPRCSSQGSPHSSSEQTGEGSRVSGPEPLQPPERAVGLGGLPGSSSMPRDSSGSGIREWLRLEMGAPGREKEGWGHSQSRDRPCPPRNGWGAPGPCPREALVYSVNEVIN